MNKQSGRKTIGMRRFTISTIGDLGVAARMRRLDLEMTIAHLAAASGTSPGFVAGLEKGKPSVSFDKLMAVLGILQMKIELKAGKPRFPKAPAASQPREEPRRNKPAMDPSRAHDDPEKIGCLECGMRVRNMLTHLASAHSMRPATYRRRWSLGEDYDLRPRKVAEQEDLRTRTRKALAKTQRPARETHPRSRRRGVAGRPDREER